MRTRRRASHTSSRGTVSPATAETTAKDFGREDANVSGQFDVACAHRVHELVQTHRRHSKRTFRAQTRHTNALGLRMSTPQMEALESWLRVSRKGESEDVRSSGGRQGAGRTQNASSEMAREDPTLSAHLPATGILRHRVLCYRYFVSFLMSTETISTLRGVDWTFDCSVFTG